MEDKRTKSNQRKQISNVEKVMRYGEKKEQYIKRQFLIFYGGMFSTAVLTASH